MFRAARRSAPAVKKIVVHLGMPKAGSTSIQLALKAAQQTRLTPNAIWFAPQDDAINDCPLYAMLVKGERAAMRAYCAAKIDDAVAAGADTVIFSAERLFTIDDAEQRIAQLGNVLREWADDVSFVIVLRDMRDFLRSYITQMIYNAGISLDDNFLAEWVVDQVRAIRQCGFRVDFIPLERRDSNRNLAEALVSVSTGREIDIALEVANVTPARPLVYALAEGLGARLAAIDSAEDVNSLEVNRFRTEFCDIYDRTMRRSDHAHEVFGIVQRVDAVIRDKVESYVQKTVRVCDFEKLKYYEDLAA